MQCCLFKSQMPARLEFSVPKKKNNCSFLSQLSVFCGGAAAEDEAHFKHVPPVMWVRCAPAPWTQTQTEP